MTALLSTLLSFCFVWLKTVKYGGEELEKGKRREEKR